jgi:Cyanobacterial TRADD-N associated 2-Transmembrane domain
MGPGPTRESELADELKRIRDTFDDQGISADMDVEFAVGAGRPRPVIKNIRLKTGPGSTQDVAAAGAIESVARADPGNIQEVAASQLEISNNYYKSVLQQAKQSFRAAIVAAGVGLAFFIAALGIGLVKNRLDVAIISSISGAVVEVISGLNFWLFGRTAAQLDLFHVRLEQTQRFVLANSVCENLSGEVRDATRSELVRLIGNSTCQQRDHVHE